jgi:outer membrane protein OmpA-like peptidoglycan-associated protein
MTKTTSTLNAATFPLALVLTGCAGESAGTTPSSNITTGSTSEGPMPMAQAQGGGAIAFRPSYNTYPLIAQYNQGVGDVNATAGVTDNHCSKSEVFFATSSTEIREGGENRLERIVECVNRGDIDGLYLIGHADARGHVVDNQQLALERAESVRRELRESGLDNDVRIFISTADEALAEGERWSDDRRVEVRYFRDLETDSKN